jgi:parvulin-like peptidyl-prolyl isomerase
MPHLSALLLIFLSLSAVADELPIKPEDILLKHKSGVYITKQELADEVKYVAAAKKIDKLPSRDILETLALQLLVTKVLSGEAEERNLHQDPATAHEINRSRDMALAEARLADIENVVIDEPVKRQLGKEYYLNNEKEFSIPEERKISHILIRHEANVEEKENQARELLQQLQDSPDQFAEVAKEKSEDTSSAKKGGSLGWATSDRFVKQFSDAAFSIEEIGQVVGPVKTKFGYHILKLDEIKPGKLKPYSEVKEVAISKAVEAFRAERRSQYLMNLRASGDRTLNEDLLHEYIGELIKKSDINAK